MMRQAAEQEDKLEIEEEKGKTATIRTEEDNRAMKNVITDLGFSIL